MTSTRRRALAQPSRSRAPPPKVVKDHRCFCSQLGIWLWMALSPVRGVFFLTPDRAGYWWVKPLLPTTYANCSADVLAWMSHADEFPSCCHVLSALTRLLQQARTVAGCSQHLSLTVMKQPFNARRQPTRVESSLFSRCGSRTVIFLIIIFIPALRPD